MDTILGKRFWVDTRPIAISIRHLGRDHVQWLLDHEDPHHEIRMKISRCQRNDHHTSARHYGNLYRALQSTRRAQLTKE